MKRFFYTLLGVFLALFLIITFSKIEVQNQGDGVTSS
jgi:hypothetical protein